MPAKNRTGYRYQIYKMGLNPEVRRAEYLDKINFWRSIETRYSEKRQQWLQKNSELVAAKQAGRIPRIEYEGESANMRGDMGTEEDDEEFSDVDSDGFADPWAQYYSSLDAESRKRIKGELMSIHLRNKEAMERAHQSATRRKILMIISGFLTLLAIGYYIFAKIFYEPEPEVPEVKVCPGCKQDVVFPIKTVMEILFPAANELDEV